MLRAWSMALCAGLVAGACRVPNPDHCANQDVPGDRYCAAHTPSLPYCSPCRRDFDGCVEFPPVGCAGYDDEVDMDADASTGASSGDSSDAASGSSSGDEATTDATDSE
jgi:hypothetical protein